MSNGDPTPVTSGSTELTRGEERRLYDAASDRVRRYVLSLVCERGRPVGTEELATHVAAWRGGKPPHRVSDAERSEAQVSLHHVHLPKLEGVGLLRRDGVGRVEATDRSLRGREWLSGAVEPGEDQDEVDRLLDLISHPLRRTLVDALDDRPGDDFPVSLEAVADDVAERGGARIDAGPPGGGRERLRVVLHHQHLPKLADAGVVTYDRQDRTVTFEGLPATGEN